DVPSRTSRRPLAHIVLMSDGSTNTGRSNESAAAAARRARVPVTTIAFGTDEGTIRTGGEEYPVPVDREALREIADTTRGRFYEAQSAEQLQSVTATSARRSASAPCSVRRRRGSSGSRWCSRSQARPRRSSGPRDCPEPAASPRAGTALVRSRQGALREHLA